MTCLLGSICNQPEQMGRALEPVRHLLMAPAPVARWGMGYAQGGEILLSRSPRRQADAVDFYAAIQPLRSDYVIAHACAPDDLSGNANTQPFRYRQWMFAQEGCERGTPELQAALAELIPDFLQRNIRGKTLAEHLFHVFLTLLHRDGSLDHADLSPARSCELLSQSVRMAQEAAARTGAGSGLASIMASNGRSFVAVRLGQPLYTRRLTVPAPRGSREDSFRGVLVVSSSTPPGEGFEEIPGHAALQVGRTVHPDIARFPL